ncbi:MAG: zinc-dependent alcohol dehydrogenase family protein [Gammaproteobacteria bacterium]|nr:zinc-dependent alcohol dehydrogenase family protein [Gammaproteobacteria bacterium]
MRAMLMQHWGEKLQYIELPIPHPHENEILIKVHVCGICRTDLHIVEGDLTQPKLPLIPGHQIVGEIVQLGKNVSGFHVGQRIGVPWLGGSCAHCSYCLSTRENLCESPRFTGYQIDGGFAEYCVADSRFCFPLPAMYPDAQAAPLLCAGLIGYRALRKTNHAKHIGIYGFGAAAHILTQVAKFQGREIYAFTRPGDSAAQIFAKQLGVKWVGSSEHPPPFLLDAAIIFAPDGKLVPIALQAVAKGGIVVCGGIHMSDIPSFPYDILWGERTLCSIANLTRYDGEEFLALAPKIPIKTEVHTYPLIKVNEALDDLRHGRFTGAAVIEISGNDCQQT